MHPPIPKGWYKLAYGERILVGDMCWSKSYSEDHEWEQCIGLVGQQVGVQENRYKDVIRKEKKEPEPDKVWLNPWD